MYKITVPVHGQPVTIYFNNTLAVFPSDVRGKDRCTLHHGIINTAPYLVEMSAEKVVELIDKAIAI